MAGDVRSLAVKSKLTLLFDIGLVIKGIDSVLEVIGGVLLLFPVRLSDYLEVLSQHSKHDFVARNLERLAGSVSTATALSAIYLMIHGVAKAVLIVAALKQRAWGYIGLMVVLLFFASIEMVRFFFVRKMGLLVFSLFDVALVLLIANEYRTRKKMAADPLH